jgi:hypothetical protein
MASASTTQRSAGHRQEGKRISAITKAEFIMRQSFLVPSSWFFRPHRDGALQRFTRSSRYFPGAKF